MLKLLNGELHLNLRIFLLNKCCYNINLLIVTVEMRFLKTIMSLKTVLVENKYIKNIEILHMNYY